MALTIIGIINTFLFHFGSLTRRMRAHCVSQCAKNNAGYNPLFAPKFVHTFGFYSGAFMFALIPFLEMIVIGTY